MTLEGKYMLSLAGGRIPSEQISFTAPRFARSIFQNEVPERHVSIHRRSAVDEKRHDWIAGRRVFQFRKIVRAACYSYGQPRNYVEGLSIDFVQALGWLWATITYINGRLFGPL